MPHSQLSMRSTSQCALPSFRAGIQTGISSLGNRASALLNSRLAQSALKNISRFLNKRPSMRLNAFTIEPRNWLRPVEYRFKSSIGPRLH
jgi:hypothetical protein